LIGKRKKKPGQYTLLARAKDANGTVQSEHDWNYGSYVITHLLPIDVLVEDPRATGAMRLALGAELDVRPLRFS
jgi:hypothetical protein